MTYPYIIIDDNPESIQSTIAMASGFQSLSYVGSAQSYEDGISLILEHQPKLVFMEISPLEKDSRLSLHLINELHRYLSVLPRIIITTATKELAYEAIKYEVADYLIKPLQLGDFRKAILKINKNDGHILQVPAPVFLSPASSAIAIVKEATEIDTAAAISAEVVIMEDLNGHSPEAIVVDSQEDDATILTEEESENDIVAQSLEIINGHLSKPVETGPETLVMELPATADQAVPKEKPLVICVKSYGDYRFINASDICYLEADNNSTDIHISNGEIITAFKTLKHFETVLVMPFVRIHNSYIVNVDYVSRIHTGNSVCYIKDTTIKLPFSKTYKENIDSILSSITEGNYLET